LKKQRQDKTLSSVQDMAGNGPVCQRRPLWSCSIAIFIIDRLFPRVSVYPHNRIFIERLASVDAAISSFTLLELCGVASFRLSAQELDDWLFGFDAMYPT
jgi:hypothetical protein